MTEYPNLQRIRKELNLLQKLYNLYNSVIDNVNGYYDILWQEIDIEKINNELLEYQNRYVWGAGMAPRFLKSPQTVLESRDGSGARALAYHQYGPCSIPARCHMWIEFVFCSHLAWRVFVRVSPVFLPPQKPTLQIDQDRGLKTSV